MTTNIPMTTCRRGNCTYNRPFAKCIHYILLWHSFVFSYLYYGNNCSTAMDTEKIKFNAKKREKSRRNGHQKQTDMRKKNKKWEKCLKPSSISLLFLSLLHQHAGRIAKPQTNHHNIKKLLLLAIKMHQRVCVATQKRWNGNLATWKIGRTQYSLIKSCKLFISFFLYDVQNKIPIILKWKVCGPQFCAYWNKNKLFYK